MLMRLQGTHYKSTKNYVLWINKEYIITDDNAHATAKHVLSQICINIHPDAVPPIHAESYHVATDKGPLPVPVYF